MSEFLRKYWFICLVGIGLFSILIFYVADLNKDNVSGKKADGVSVIASLSDGNVTSDELFDRYQDYNQSLLYNMYRNAVVDQSVEADSDMKSVVKTMVKNIQSNMDADSTGQTAMGVESELASYGFEGSSALEDYCMMTQKIKKLDRQYVEEHLSEYIDTLTTSPRVVSVITMSVTDPANLTEDEMAKQELIDNALEEGQDFASVATAQSEDVTAATKGLYGYVDSSTTDLDSTLVEQITAMSKGETSDWIAVLPDSSVNYTMYKVYINEDDPTAIFNYENSDVQDAILTAILTANSNAEMKAVVDAADKLNITWDNEDVKTKIDEYIKQYIGEEEEE